jgi:hypothetical protein
MGKRSNLKENSVLRTTGNLTNRIPDDLPLVESVRRQYRIRDAELRGETELVQELQNESRLSGG